MSLTRMSPVQAAVFPLLPKLAEPYDPKAPEDDPARDILVKAKTGTGKTLAFLVPAVEARLKAVEEHAQKVCLDAGRASDDGLARRARMAYRSEHVGALIISPTRELATQIVHEAQRLTAHLDDFGVRLFVGGASKGPQMRDWMRGKRDILVATPGRLRDFIQTEPEVSRGLAKTPIVRLHIRISFGMFSYYHDSLSWMKLILSLIWVSVPTLMTLLRTSLLFPRGKHSFSLPPSPHRFKILPNKCWLQTIDSSTVFTKTTPRFMRMSHNTIPSSAAPASRSRTSFNYLHTTNSITPVHLKFLSFSPPPR